MVFRRSPWRRGGPWPRGSCALVEYTYTSTYTHTHTHIHTHKTTCIYINIPIYIYIYGCQNLSIHIHMYIYIYIYIYAHTCIHKNTYGLICIHINTCHLMAMAPRRSPWRRGAPWPPASGPSSTSGRAAAPVHPGGAFSVVNQHRSGLSFKRGWLI